MTARRRLLAAIGLALAAATLLLLVRLNRSASLLRGLYLAIPRAWRARPPARGDLVLACAPPAAAELARRRGYLPDGPCHAGANRGAQALGKVVPAVAGDDVDLEPGGLAVNGRPVAASRPLGRDAAGRPLPHAAFGSRRLAPGELWLFAPYHPRSYDSRYFGPVPGPRCVAGCCRSPSPTTTASPASRSTVSTPRCSRQAARRSPVAASRAPPPPAGSRVPPPPAGRGAP